MCGRKMRVTYGKKSITVTCPGCAVGSLDLTPTAFQQFAALGVGVGRLHGIKWTLL
ncbi:hypothetical protein GSI_10249 [Ganoderma sinense ZZ0214-1]|uniref:Uncharacterized protein n=1 Tax=Ganoderma sinense ZZ0214-1 TaxID=1077348 RepID=A0A2G8S010_9APHY|nr:hypothetical protein GSI_10249 [Ganoderma sinense ZZ0214-1]